MAVGYVNPDREPEPRGFDDQFEWDGHGWLFRRFHRARPVRVTADEMDQCINFYARWNGRLGYGLFGVWLVGAILWAFFGPQEGGWANRRFHGLGTLAAFAVGWAGSHWLWLKATDRFSRRVPVGLGRTWLEDRQSQATERGWTDLIAPILFLTVGTGMLWPLDEARWFDFALAAVAGLAAILDVVLKLRARFL